MSWEIVVILAFVLVLSIYATKHLPKAIKQLKKELGD